MTARYENEPINVLARAIAAHFGGEQDLSRQYDGEYSERCATVVFPAVGERPAFNLSLDIETYGAKKGAVSMTVYPVKLDNDVNRSGITFPSIGFGAGRDTDAIIKGIQKRLLDNAETSIQLQMYNNRLQALYDDRQKVKDNLAEILATVPGTYTVDHFPPNSYDARFFGKGGDSFDARVYATGSVTIDRLHSISMDKAKRIMAILAE